MQKIVFLLVSLFVLSTLSAQQNLLSDEAEISVLTIGPGASLNDAFGHSGFRIKDKRYGKDLVFNYGVYDFNTPNFYLKFAQGKLNYLLGVNYFEDFYESYIRQDRTIKEQILNLNQSEKQRLFNALLENAKPENRAYLYDFFYDNCATKIKDVLNLTLDNKIAFNTPENYKEQTFRELIQDNLNKNSWGSLGIDIALGSIIDKTATAEEHMFLPENIFRFFNNASYKGKPLVTKVNTLYEQQKPFKKANLLSSPLFIFGLISLLFLFITYKDFKNNKRTKWLDSFLFAITGLIGIAILLLWFATDHTATAQNYNLLWAFALNLLVIGQVIKNTPKPWFKRYLKFLIIMLVLLTFHWIVGVQVFTIGLIPLLIAITVRYIFLMHYYANSQ